MWIEHEIRAHDTGDRAARANHRDDGVGRRERLTERSRNAAQQVEREEASVAHAVFDVVPEDPEIEHVPCDVQEAAVKKHRCEHADPGEVRGDEAEREHELIDGRPERELIQKDEHVERDERDRHVGRCARGDDVAEWDHGLSALGSGLRLRSSVCRYITSCEPNNEH